MLLLSAILLLLPPSETAFVVGASAERSYTIGLPREALRTFVDDIGLFQRHMPGVVRVDTLDNGDLLYQTEKHVPLSAPMRVDFVIRKRAEGDSVTVYESARPGDRDYMLCRVAIHPEDSTSTRISIRLEIRMIRERPSQVHWLAPVLGAEFISGQMQGDLEEMLTEFIETSSQELYAALRGTSVVERR